MPISALDATSDSNATRPACLAVVGGFGMFGHIGLRELVRSTGIARVVLLSRKERKTPTFDDARVALEVRKTDFFNLESCIASLEGCTGLVSFMGTEGDYMAAKKILIQAASNVRSLRWYIPSDWGIDHTVTDTTLFQHSCWLDKAAHQRYAQSLGLKTVSIYIGLFLQHPWGAFDIWHGFSRAERTWAIAGSGDEQLTLTSKYDVARAARRVAELLLSDMSSVPDHIRVRGITHSPAEMLTIFNSALPPDSTRYSLKPLLLEGDIQQQLLKQAVAPTDPVELELLGPDFDPVFASEIAERIFRGMGQGLILGAGPDHNEWLNPKESLWKWDTLEEYARQVHGEP